VWEDGIEKWKERRSSSVVVSTVQFDVDKGNVPHPRFLQQVGWRWYASHLRDRRVVFVFVVMSVPRGREQVGCQGSKTIVWMVGCQYHGRVFELVPGSTAGWQGPEWRHPIKCSWKR